MLEWLKTKKRYLLVAALVLGGCVLAFGSQNGQNGQKYEEFTVAATSLGQMVEATGFLEPTTSINLSFQKSGEVFSVKTDVGQRVKKGQVLAELQNDTEKALLLQNKASLAEAKASLNLKLAKATDQDIAIARSDVQQSVALKEKAQVDYANAKTDLENTKKTVEQDVRTAELQVENAKLTLQKVQISSTTATQQTASSLTNATVALKASMAQLLVSAKAVLQNTDKVFGFEGPSIFDTIQAPLNITTSSEYNTAQNEYSENSRNYKTLQAQYDLLPGNPSSNDLLALTPNVQAFTRALNEGTLAVTVVLDKTTTNGEFPYASLSQLRSDITTSASSLNSAIASYNAAKKSLDDAVINESGTGSSSPLDVQSAQLLVQQQEQNLTKVRVNGETMVSSKETMVKSLQAQLQVAESNVDRSNASLEKVLASPRAVDIAPYQARVQQAQALVAKAQSDYDNTLITAPFDGMITAKNIDAGEQFLITSGVTNEPALGIIDDSDFHIDVNIPETQVNKVAADSTVRVTFDALGPDEKFDGKILSVEPASTTIDDVIYFKMKVVLTKSDKRLRAGMTANVNITTTSPQTVLVIPERALTIDAGNKKTVRISKDNTVEIRTGARGKNGTIEVVSGLKEGDRILVPMN